MVLLVEGIPRIDLNTAVLLTKYMDQDRFNQEMERYIRERRKLEEEHGEIDTGTVGSGTSLWEDIKSFFAPDETEEVTHIEELDEEDEEPDEELSEEEMEKLEEELDENIDEQAEADEPAVEDDLEVPKPTLVERFFSLFESSEPAEEFDEFDPEHYAEEESERVMFEEDVKEILRIAHDWIEELPGEKLREFKESEDFERYQELLDKLDLLKED